MNQVERTRPLSRKAAAAAGAQAPAYRPDIDGLRAISVMAVVLYHAGLPIPGGFVGVDVFFVISGYLIAAQIYREVAERRFTFRGFYARRARRILPALAGMLVGFLLLGSLVLTPLELRELGKEAVAAILGLSNLLFFSGGGYFEPAAEYDPLLMSWSLGVEEQFYLIFPLIVLALVRLPERRRIGVLAVLSLLSFAGSIVLTHVNQKAAFYLIPTRAWELGLGALLALWEHRRPQAAAFGAGSAFAEGAALLGGALILAALFAYSPGFEFPGAFAALPTLGAVLLLASRASGFNRWVLTCRPLPFIGKISYSWYLWHWPVFYLQRAFAGGAPSQPAPVLILVSFALAVLSWRFIEQPFRARRAPEWRVLSAYGALICAVAVAGALFYVAGGAPGRLGPQAQRMAGAVAASRASPCLAPYGATSPANVAVCLPTDGRARAVILGDSHADAIAPGVKALVQAHGLGFGEMTKSSCLPLLGAGRALPDRPSHLDECLRYQDQAFRYVEQHPEVKVVVLAGYWSAGLQLETRAGQPEALGVALDDTIRRLEAMGRRVVLVRDVPIFRFDPYARTFAEFMPLRRWFAQRLAGAEPGVAAAAAETVPDTSGDLLAEISRRRPEVFVIDPARALCSQGACRYAADGAVYYSDFQHLTASGARQAMAGVDLPF